MLNQLVKEIKKHSNPVRAKISASFFKTSKGDYGYGDIFLGLTGPQQKILAK